MLFKQLLDADYEAFLENLSKKVEPFPSAEVYVEEMEQTKSSGNLYLCSSFIYHYSSFISLSFTLLLYGPLFFTTSAFTYKISFVVQILFL